MPRKPAFSIENLIELGSRKLAQLVLNEAKRNTRFRLQVNVALAGKSGPDAVARLIDRRLSGLERAKSSINWDKVNALADDLDRLVIMIKTELGPVAPALAVDRLIRFIATSQGVMERVKSSWGRVGDIYHQAHIWTGELIDGLSEAEADLLPEKIMARLGKFEEGDLTALTNAVALKLRQATLARWDADLSAAIKQRRVEEAKLPTGQRDSSMIFLLAEMRQTIATVSGDLDLVIELEAAKPADKQDTMDIARRLLEGGRAEEALAWVRKPDLRFGKIFVDPLGPDKVSLEARILDALDEKSAAQSLRWQSFEERLSTAILREYLKNLPDFEDIEAEDRALSHAMSYSDSIRALKFYQDWSRPDLVAQLIVQRHAQWYDYGWYDLSTVAEYLGYQYPLATTILYRALLDNILESGRSKAYGNGAEYLAHLDLLANDADPLLPDGMNNHAAYLTNLRKDHGRKYGFWSRID